MKMGTIDCGSETVTCQDIKMELKIELHQTKESIGKTEVRLKKVEMESKQKLEQLQDLKSKVSHFSSVFIYVNIVLLCDSYCYVDNYSSPCTPESCSQHIVTLTGFQSGGRQKHCN